MTEVFNRVTEHGSVHTIFVSTVLLFENRCQVHIKQITGLKKELIEIVGSPEHFIWERIRAIANDKGYVENLNK